MANDYGPGRATAEERFGAEVRAKRLAAGLTQGQLAAAMTHRGSPIHQTTIAKLEAGTRPTSVAEVVTLAGILGVPAGSLFPSAAEMSRAEAEMHRIDKAIAETRAAIEDADAEVERWRGKLLSAHQALTDVVNGMDRATAVRDELGQSLEQHLRDRRAWLEAQRLDAFSGTPDLFDYVPGGDRAS